ncbi:Predicted arabinose efflux permease, MFS family [Amycolatopsis marina]|uniref:Predicted arabinose efflux permease, MFS family n=1 Tax=Amycolatopsis marina TaxID=490629 RepID=A0A1I1B1Q2_9PSEU|nr:MFS transporter [Amycolatopsis marina]SFB44274.1 Predicted arabinose efflux permease, MFS family [Amycolatopsis marina]
MAKPGLPGWLYVLFLTLLATATDEFIIAGVLREIARDLEVGVAAAGQLVTVFAVVYAVGAPTLAVAFDRFPRRSVMVCGLAVFVLANAAAALAPGYAALLTARVAAALGAAVITAAAFTTAAMGAPAGMRGRYLGVATAGMTAALFTGVPLGTWLGVAMGWRATFWLIAAVGVLAAAGLLGTAPSVPGSSTAPLRTRFAPLRSARVLRLVAVTFTAASGGLMFYTYLAAYVAEVATGSGVLLATALFVVGVAGLAGALLAGRAADALGLPRSLRWVIGGHALALLLLAGYAFSDLTGPLSLGLLVALIALWSVFAWGLNPPIQGSIMAAAGAESAMPALALNISGLYLGTGVAGAIGGAVVAAADVRFVPLAGGVLMMLSFLLTHIPLDSTGSTADAPGTGPRDAPQKTADVPSPSTLT